MKSLAILAVTALTAPALASISATGLGCVQIAPPAVANFPTLFSNNAEAWDELQGVAVANVLCDMTVNPSNSSTPSPGLVSGLVDSHFIHFTHGTAFMVSGDIWFNDPIVGVMFNDTLLDTSDWLGSGGTLYPTGQIGRGTSLLNGSNIMINGNYMHFTLNDFSPVVEISQLRVLTRPVPAPGAAAVAGLGGLLALRRRRA
ncbi:hypothetical protein PHYC_01108 [Phycisphaerales bacterium]|nr:hypothetical protein PHYC_01108 [Phycisphaerales bacterium]